MSLCICPHIFPAGCLGTGSLVPRQGQTLSIVSKSTNCTYTPNYVCYYLCPVSGQQINQRENGLRRQETERVQSGPCWVLKLTGFTKLVAHLFDAFLIIKILGSDRKHLFEGLPSLSPCRRTAFASAAFKMEVFWEQQINYCLQGKAAGDPGRWLSQMQTLAEAFRDVVQKSACARIHGRKLSAWYWLWHLPARIGFFSWSWKLLLTLA